jgi:hypothetical protein
MDILRLASLIFVNILSEHPFLPFLRGLIGAIRYIIFELLKNVSFWTVLLTESEPSLQAGNTCYLCSASASCFFAVSSGHDRCWRYQMKVVLGSPPVNLLMSVSQGGGLLSAENLIENASDLFSFSHVRNAARMDVSRLGALRSASASETGVRGTIGEQLGRWQQARELYSTNSVIDDAAVQQILHPRIGIGLPMSYIYARYRFPRLILCFNQMSKSTFIGILVGAWN